MIAAMKDSNTPPQMLSKRTECEDHFDEWMKMTSAPKPALLIDDSKDETELIVSQSRAFNIRWDVCHDGKQALEKIQRNRYQLVVLDLKLGHHPEGVELYQRIKQMAPLCPVLVLSGYITNDAIVEITRLGFAMFAQKPSVFTSDFFEQLFLALNIPKRPSENGPPTTLGDNI